MPIPRARQSILSPLGNALADLCEDAKTFDPSFEFVKSVAGLLDKHDIGARYPQTLTDGAPCQAYEALDSERALEIASETLRGIEEELGLNQ